MADPLTVGASIIGVVVPALHGIRLLQRDVQKVQEAPTAVKNLEDDISALISSIESLKSIEEADWKALGSTVSSQCEATVTACTQACATFNRDLQRWTRRSKEGGLSWRDRAKIGFFKQSQMKAISEHLQSCKLTCNNIVSIATL